MRFLIFIFATVFLTSCSTPQSALPFSGFRTATLPPPKGFPDIFKNYRRESDSDMMGGWVRNFDFSGVSFDDRRTATLVTRRHVVMANHYKRPVGARVIFHDRKGKRLLRTLTATKKVFGDVAVGVLNEDVPSNFRVYPIPHPDTPYDSLTDRPVIVTDQARRVFFHRIRVANPVAVGFLHDKQDRHGWGKKLISGDSGNPSFLLSNGELVLIETHTSGGPGAGPYYGSPKVQIPLQKAIDELTPGYRLTYRKL